ncbi:nucleotide-binding universal stress UspA family protein [Saccharothrix tamanrassetensis]|uniref:Nucleotide-binding universal stress UspA family protein n=1 Tax=Saccharothrix tamanrassetensis TaxID=1051531 RepID=A0A841CPU4_9PSEU|nr:universal stress protein [Saccharothrix tamanrassetensis]MBB5960442.1 nucleotide-binding universal stress UspA family protein [Saccharothrix tamanrassetensis]
MDKTVVVGVDGSQVSRNALRWAVEDAERRGCAVEAILAWHVDYGLVAGPMSATAAASVDRERVREAYQAVLDDVVRDVDGNVRPVLAEGDARDVLAKASEHAVLLVVGSHGAGPIREALLGSVSSHCVHHAACPVVVVREPK